MLVNELEVHLSQAEFTPDAVAQEIVADTRSAAQHALRHLDEENPQRARMLISGLGEHALAPLSQAPRGLTPENEVWVLGTLAEELRQFRKRVAELIEPLLTPDNPSTADTGMRDCDEAYRLAHDLANVAAEAKQVLRFDRFLQMPKDMRDEEIRQFLKSRPWRRILGGF